MNKLDIQYQDLLRTILDKGNVKEVRNGTTSSTFGNPIRHNMSEGFPALTTKKLHFNGVVAELLWFLRGRTNIRYLLDDNCHIWDGDCYKRYVDSFGKTYHSDTFLSKEDFISKIKNDPDFWDHHDHKYPNITSTNISSFGMIHGELGPIYGYQWRNWGGDQITRVINELKVNPDSRRLLVSAWNVEDIDGGNMVLPPCHIGFQFYTKKMSFNWRYRIGGYQPYDITGLVDYEEGLDYITQEQFEAYHNAEMDKLNIPTRKISLLWTQRSCDVPLGLPYNIASYGLLLTIIGKMVNMVPDELIGTLGDTHIYSNQIEGCIEQINRKPYNLPSLSISDNLNFSGDIDDLLKTCNPSDFSLVNYESHPSIKFPLSN